jgi:hypothetical protein
MGTITDPDGESSTKISTLRIGTRTHQTFLQYSNYSTPSVQGSDPSQLSPIAMAMTKPGGSDAHTDRRQGRFYDVESPAAENSEIYIGRAF